MPKYDDMRKGYENLFAQMSIDPNQRLAAEIIAVKLIAQRSRYETVASQIRCPWWFIAIIHNLESNANFTRHLHNGDPLTARTSHVPEGRPLEGSPPFTWEESSLDALRLKGLDKITTWEIPRCLFEWERYNGWGYIGKENSPYVWAWSNLSDETGKYVKDHVYDANAPTKQCGAAVILRAMINLGVVVLTDRNLVVPIRKNAMSELSDFLKQFARIAPTLVSVIAGPGPALAVKALAEALTKETGVDTGEGLLAPKPEVVMDKLEKSPLTTVVNVIQAAEAIIELIIDKTSAPVAPAVIPVTPTVITTQPSTPVIVAVPTPPSEVTTTVETKPEPVSGIDVLDRMFPQLQGWKTYIAIAIYVGGNIAAVMVPTIITPDILTAITWLAGGIGGAGLISKMDRYLSIFKPSSKTTTVSTK